MSEHTKGDWFSIYVADLGFQVCENEKYQLEIAKVVGDNFRSFEEREANARLIAAAPDMFEVLKAAKHAVAMLEKDNGRVEHEGLSLYEKIEQVLAKAKGEQKLIDTTP
jgi:hypothetical protein